MEALYVEKNENPTESLDCYLSKALADSFVSAFDLPVKRCLSGSKLAGRSSLLLICLSSDSIDIGFKGEKLYENVLFVYLKTTEPFFNQKKKKSLLLSAFPLYSFRVNKSPLFPNHLDAKK